MYKVAIGFLGQSRSIYLTSKTQPKIRKGEDGRITGASLKRVDDSELGPKDKYREHVAYIDWSAVASVAWHVWPNSNEQEDDKPSNAPVVEIKLPSKSGKTRAERKDIEFLVWLMNQKDPHYALVQDFLGLGQKKSGAFVRQLHSKGLIEIEKAGRRTVFYVSDEGTQYLAEQGVE